MEPDSRGVSNVQVVTDHFTRYAQAVPTQNQKITVRKSVLYIMAFHHFNLGRDIQSQFIKQLLTTLDIQKSRPTPYNPQGEPEHFNRTMLSILAMLNKEKKRNGVNTKYILYMTIRALSVMPQDTPCFF